MAGRYALLISNGTYEDPKLKSLRSPGVDVRLLSEVLKDPEIGRYDVAAVTEQPWHKVQEAIGDFFGSRQPDDLLLLYLSCHGVKSDEGELFFAAKDTTLDRLTYTAMPASRITRQLERSRARRILVIIDACFSGAFPLGLAAKGSGSLDLSELHVEGEAGRGVAVLTASSSMEYAFEGVESVVDDPEPSIFTGILIRGLQSGDADSDNDGLVSITDLHAFVSSELSKAGSRQRPQLHTRGLEGHVAVSWGSRRVIPSEPSGSIPARRPVALADLIETAIEEIEGASHLEKVPGPGIATGFDDLDRLLVGLFPGELVIVYGQPSSGKSSLALSIARSSAIHQSVSTLFLTLESRASEIVNRILAAEGRIPKTNMTRGLMREEDWTRLARTMGELSEAPIYVLDQPISGMKELTAIVRGANDCRLVIVDPLTLLGDLDRSAKADLCRSLKLLAASSGTTIIATVNSDPDPWRPVIPSGLDEHADMMIGIYRPDMHDRESPRAGEADLVLSKNRRGQTDTITVAFQGHYARFIDMAV